MSSQQTQKITAADYRKLLEEKQALEERLAKAEAKKVITEKVLDHERKETADTRDPRSQGKGPCGMDHRPYLHAAKNQYGEWKDCQVCGLRLEYVPYVGAPAQRVKHDLGANVTLALNELKSQGIWENMRHKDFKAKIAEMAEREKQKTVKSTPKPKPRAKSKEVTISPRVQYHHIADDEDRVIDDSPPTIPQRKSKRANAEEVPVDEIDNYTLVEETEISPTAAPSGIPR